MTDNLKNKVAKLFCDYWIGVDAFDTVAPDKRLAMLDVAEQAISLILPEYNQLSAELKQLRAEQAGLLEDVEHILYRTAEARKDGVCSWSHCLNEIRAAAIKLKSRLTQTQNQQKGTDDE